MIAQNKSIRHKLMRVILMTSSAVLLLTFAAFFIYELVSYRQISFQQLSTLGRIIAANSTAALAFDSQKDADEILAALKAEENILTACLYDENGVLFSGYPKTASRNDFPPKPMRDGYRFLENHIEGFQPVEQGEKRLGTLYIKRSMDDMFERFFLYALIACLVMGICFLLAYLLSKKLQRGISFPIISLAETSRMVSQQHDYSIRARKISDDETGLLTEAFNNMLGQIEIQNKEIQLAHEKAQQYALELEEKVNQRTIEFKKQKDFAETILNSSLVLIAAFDNETKLIAFNERCEAEFGKKKAEVLGKKFIDVFPGIDDSLTYNSVLKALKGHVVHNAQYRSGITGNYYESYILPLKNENNEVYAVLMTAHNISETVESTEKVKQANMELLRKNSELEQFAYVASHDLQEPLRKIQTFIQLIKKNQDDMQFADKYMDKVETSAERMSALIKDVLEFSRLSQPQEGFAETDLNLVLEYVKSDFELLIMQREVEIVCDQLPIIPGNKLQLHQLFANLINNAIKFCDTKPVIKIASSTVNGQEIIAYPELNSKQDYLKLVFADNGIGFDQRFATKIFTIFQRLNTRENYEGTGIGLALCKKIVENHNGHIQVNSEPGKGTAFTILLPLR